MAARAPGRVGTAGIEEVGDPPRGNDHPERPTNRVRPSSSSSLCETLTKVSDRRTFVTSGIRPERERAKTITYPSQRVDVTNIRRAKGPPPRHCRFSESLVLSSDRLTHFAA